MLAVCTILVAVLGALFAHRTEADQFDRALDAVVVNWFAQQPELAARLAAPGSAIPAFLLSAVVFSVCVLRRRLNGAVLAMTAVPVSVGLDEVLLKPLVHRTYLGILTYPSGHTTAMFALATTVTILFLVPDSPGKAWRVRALVASALSLMGVVVAVAVIGLRWHYVTDTIAGAAVGIATACGLALALDLSLGSWFGAPGTPHPCPSLRFAPSRRDAHDPLDETAVNDHATGEQDREAPIHPPTAA